MTYYCSYASPAADFWPVPFPPTALVPVPIKAFVSLVSNSSTALPMPALPAPTYKAVLFSRFLRGSFAVLGSVEVGLAAARAGALRLGEGLMAVGLIALMSSISNFLMFLNSLPA